MVDSAVVWPVLVVWRVKLPRTQGEVLAGGKNEPEDKASEGHTCHPEPHERGINHHGQLHFPSLTLGL